ncbi:MAG: site-specific DNA-methyltransferase [Anaerolineales bacterium]|nr:site-specific DNA-methyltransferase [Anaerolineales bacterium]
MPTLTWASKSETAPSPSRLTLDSVIYPGGEGYPEAGHENKVILGDNLGVMAGLLEEYEERIQLIYTDPPFFTNRHYPARTGRGEDSRQPQGWQLAEGYPDRWQDLDAYLDMLYARLRLIHRLLAPNGTLYLHLDWHASAYARLLLDEIFGAERLLNEIVWVYHGPSPIRKAFNRKHDTILAYTKGEGYTFNVDQVRQPYDATTVKTFASSPRAGFGKQPDLARGKVPEDWWYFPVVARLHKERTGYPTQKPAGLVERILLASSNPGDLTADFFCGAGTLAAAAAKLGRRFIVNDNAWLAVHTTRSRLVEMAAAPFGMYTAEGSGPERFEAPVGGVRLRGEEVELEEALAEGLDYWEVDPAWDGRVFCSAAQARRPRRQGKLPRKLRVGFLAEGEGACVRLVSQGGAQAQVETRRTD